VRSNCGKRNAIRQNPLVIVQTAAARCKYKLPTQAAAIIKETAHPDVNLIFGAVIDPSMGDELRITVIATGFERTGIPRRLLEKSSKPRVNEYEKIPEPSEVAASTGKPSDFQPRTFNTEDLDIPTFLRNRSR